MTTASPTLALLPTAPLPADRVAALEAATRADLGGAIANLAALRAGDAHTTAGYPSWSAYALDRFGDLLRELALPVADRRELTAHLRREGTSYRAIAARLGVSKSTAKNDVHAVEGDTPGALATVVTATDGRRLAAVGDRSPQPAPAPVFTPEPGMSKRAQVAARVAFAGAAGLTCLELEEATGWRHGAASSPLSWAKRVGAAVPTGTYREGYEVYVGPPQQ